MSKEKGYVKEYTALNALATEFKVEFGHKNCHPETCTCDNWRVYKGNVFKIGFEHLKYVQEYIEDRDTGYTGPRTVERTVSVLEKAIYGDLSHTQFVTVSELEEACRKSSKYKEGKELLYMQGPHSILIGYMRKKKGFKKIASVSSNYYPMFKYLIERDEGKVGDPAD